MQELFPQLVKTPEAMQELGRAIATKVSPSDILALTGDLGAGKTQITKGIIEALGYQDSVTSPTFSIAQEYRDTNIPAIHFDLYRLEEPNELLAIGWEEYLESGALLIVEWADRFPELMPSGSHCLHIEHVEEGRLVSYAPLD